MLFPTQRCASDWRVLRPAPSQLAAWVGEEILSHGPPAARMGKEDGAAPGGSRASIGAASRRVPARAYRWLRRHLHSADAGGRRRVRHFRAALDGRVIQTD